MAYYYDKIGDKFQGESCPMPLHIENESYPENGIGQGEVEFSDSYIEGDNICYDMYLPRSAVAWCGNPVNIKWPREWCYKDGCPKYAYVAILYPDNKGNLTYLDGALGVALGLRKQGTSADIICMITTDVKEEDIKKLELVFDRIITVPYITSSKKLIEREYSIEISPEIYRDCDWYKTIPDCGHAYCHVFTKIHILRLIEYEKVAIVDLDIIPIENYDSIFSINTPAGILEAPRFNFGDNLEYGDAENEPFKKSCKAGLKLGDLIPHKFTDIDKPTGADINAGLLVLKPDIEEFNKIIKELQKPRREWFDKKGLRIQKMDGTWENSYCFPEQNYLTKRWSGKWHLIDWGYATWQIDADLAFGIHMAGHEGKKPWMSQPINYYMYNQEEKKKLGYVAYSIAEFNRVYLWALNKYPRMRRILLRDLVFYGAYRTFVDKSCNDVPLRSQYPELTDKDKLYWYELKRGRGNDAIRNLLAPEQRMIVDLLEE